MTDARETLFAEWFDTFYIPEIGGYWVGPEIQRAILDGTWVGRAMEWKADRERAR